MNLGAKCVFDDEICVLDVTFMHYYICKQQPLLW